MSDEVHTGMLGFVEGSDKYKKKVAECQQLENDKIKMAQRIDDMQTWIHTLYKAAMDLKEDAKTESVNLKEMEHNIILRRDDYKKEIKDLETDKISLTQRINSLESWIRSLYRTAMDLDLSEIGPGINPGTWKNNIRTRKESYKQEIKDLKHTIRENEVIFAEHVELATAGWMKEKQDLQETIQDLEDELIKHTAHEEDPDLAVEAEKFQNPFLIPL